MQWQCVKFKLNTSLLAFKNQQQLKHMLTQSAAGRSWPCQRIRQGWGCKCGPLTGANFCHMCCRAVLPTEPKCSAWHTHTDTHTWTVTTGSSRKLWRAHTHSDIVSFFHLRSSRMNSRSITNCTQREQDEKNNLESRGRAGGCAAPCSTGVTAPLHHHNKAKGTLGKKSHIDKVCQRSQLVCIRYSI